MNIISRFFLSLALLLLSFSLQATHIVGADLTYECVNASTNTYRVEVTMYRDCSPQVTTGFDANITLFIFNGDNGALFSTINIRRPFTTPKIIPIDWDVCTGRPSTVCVEFGKYITTTSLPPRIGGYDIAWSRCCRNNSVTNIRTGGPQSQGITLLGHVPSLDVQGCNSMPVFQKLAPLFLCAGQVFNFDHSATDADGDSLVYTVSNPYSGENFQGLGTSTTGPTVNAGNPMGRPPYRNVNYLGGYTFNDPFGTGNFNIDAQSGFLTLTPTQTGIFVFAISVLEYRNGVLMSENKRDFQINVVRCQPQGNPPSINHDLSGTNHSGRVINVQPLDTVCYAVTVSDPAASDTVALFPVSAIFGIGATLPPPFATLTQSGINPVNGQVCWIPSCEYAGKTVTLIIGGLDSSDCKGYNIVFDTAYVRVGGNNRPSLTHQLPGGGDSATVKVGENICYTYRATDVDPKNGIIVAPFQGTFAALGGTASFTSAGENPNTGQICWTPGCEDAGQTFEFVIRAVDTNYCNLVHPTLDKVWITVEPTPDVSTPDTVQACASRRISLSATTTGPGTILWSPAAALSDPTSLTPSLLTTTAQNYIVTFTDTFNCEHKDTIFVKPIPLPNIQIAAPAAICFGDSIPLLASGGVSYRWLPPLGLSNGNIPNPIAFPLASTSWDLIVTAANGCIDTATYSLAVNTLPGVSAGNDTAKCGNVGIQITATGAVSYVWTPALGLSNPNIANPIANPDSTTVYTVVGTDANGCQNTDSLKVRAFYADAGPDFEVCIFETTQLNARANGVTYLWNADPSILDPLNIPNPRVYTTVSKMYIITVTDTVGCTDKDTVQLKVNPLPVTTATDPDPYVCSGGPTRLTATGGVIYHWTPTNTVDDPDSATTLARPVFFGPGISDSTSYYVTVIDTNGCVNYDSLKLEIRIRPLIEVSADTFVCPGDTVPIWVSGGFGVLNTRWEFPPNDGDTLFWSTDSSSALAFPDSSTYFYGIVEATWGCDNRDSILVYVIDPDAGPDTTICRRDTIVMQGSGGVIYQWSPSTGLADPRDPNTLAFPIVTTTYTLVMTDSVGCTDSAMITITVNQLPPAASGGDRELCVNDTIQLLGSGGISYLWIPADSLSDDTIADPFAWPRNTTQYILAVTDTNGCTEWDTMLLTVHPLPNIYAGADTTICRKQPATLRASGGISYAWTPTASLVNPIAQQTLAFPDSTTLFHLRGMDIHTCINYDSVLVTVIQLPEAYGHPDDSICRFQLIDLWVRGNADHYLWSNGKTDTLITEIPLVSTIYWVVPYGAEGCPGDTVWINIYVEQDLPRARFEPQVVEGFHELLVPFDNQSLNASHFLWRFGYDGLTSDEFAPTHTFTRPGQYAVTLIADNDIGCPDSMIYEFIDVWKEELFLPNAFSPNGDSYNDYFYLPGGGLRDFEILIFNRWGRLVYKSNDAAFRWDGRGLKGTPVPEGVYVFKVQAKSYEGRTIQGKGTVTLFR